MIRAKGARKQKTDRENARHILKLLLKDAFPKISVRAGEIVICGNYCGTVTAQTRRVSQPGKTCSTSLRVIAPTRFLSILFPPPVKSCPDTNKYGHPFHESAIEVAKRR